MGNSIHRISKRVFSFHDVLVTNSCGRPTQVEVKDVSDTLCMILVPCDLKKKTSFKESQAQNQNVIILGSPSYQHPTHFGFYQP